MADRPRTFAEVVAAQDSAVRERLDRAERSRDPAVETEFHADVVVQEDRDGNGERRIEYQDDDGDCYVTIFAGPAAERRAATISLR